MSSSSENFYTITLMKPSLQWFTLCVLLGAVTTVAVAWGCAAFVDPFATVQPNPRKSGGSVGNDIHSGWLVGVHEAFGAKRIRSEWVDKSVHPSLIFPETYFGPAEPFIPDWAPFLLPTVDAPDELRHLRVADARGWPFLAMFSEMALDDNRGRGNKAPTITNGIVINKNALTLPSPESSVRLLPLAIIWSGFLFNTTLFGLLWFGMLKFSSVYRKTSRSRKGLCIKCKYDLRGSQHTNCPECGVKIIK